MKLSFKDLKFILEALEHLLNRYNTRLKEIEDLEEYEEEASGLGNDYLFLESLKLEIEKNINNNKSTNHDVLSQLLELQDLVESPSIAQLSMKKNELTDYDSIIQSTSNLSINERLLLVEAISQSIRKEGNLININR
jgi:hypothetical protein